MDKWIPVSERLPEQGVDVLCYLPADEFLVGQWGEIIGGGIYWVSEEHGCSWSSAPTHWMPLPQGPNYE